MTYGVSLTVMDPRFPTGKFVFDEAAAAERRRDCIAAIASFPGELKAAMAGAGSTRPTATAAGRPGRSCTTSPTAI